MVLVREALQDQSFQNADICYMTLWLTKAHAPLLLLNYSGTIVRTVPGKIAFTLEWNVHTTTEKGRNVV